MRANRKLIRSGIAAPIPFLTSLDSRAEIKGSRDPLGLVLLWSRFGRKVVGNLTTVSGSVRGFTTLLLGYYFAEEVHRVHGTQGETTLELFLKFEQLAAYSRAYVNADKDFRGQERVFSRLSKSPRVTLGADADLQILSNQRTYGLWGLFSVPGRTSGLLEPDAPVLSSVARDFVERAYIPRLTAAGPKGVRAIVDLLHRERADVHLAGKHAHIAEAVAALHSSRVSSAERKFYEHHLVRCGDVDPTHGSQPLLAQLIANVRMDDAFSMAELREVRKRAGQLSDGETLAAQLDEIRHLECLIIPMANVFAFLLARDKQTPTKIASEVRSAWGTSVSHIDVEAVEALLPQLSAIMPGENNPARRFIDSAQALKVGDYKALIHLLLDHNAHVMKARDAAPPWARLERERLDVRYRDESDALYPRAYLPHVWRSTYFINSLKQVVVQLQAE